MTGLFRPGPVLRFGAIAVLTVLVAVSAAGALGVRWDPFGRQARSLAQAEARAERARAEAFARVLEVEGERAMNARVVDLHRRAAAAETAVIHTLSEARSAPDANDLVPAERGDRLRAHDRELCRLAPDLEGCAAAP